MKLLRCQEGARLGATHWPICSPPRAKPLKALKALKAQAYIPGNTPQLPTGLTPVRPLWPNPFNLTHQMDK